MYMARKKPDVYHTGDPGLFMGTKRIPQDSPLYRGYTGGSRPRTYTGKGKEYRDMALLCMGISAVSSVVLGLYHGQALLLLFALVIVVLVAVLAFGGD